MPRFYGDRIDIVIEDGKSFEDAMKISNSSACSSEADFGYDKLPEEDKSSVERILISLEDEEEKKRDL